MKTLQQLIAPATNLPAQYQITTPVIRAGVVLGFIATALLVASHFAGLGFVSNGRWLVAGIASAGFFALWMISLNSKAQIAIGMLHGYFALSWLFPLAVYAIGTPALYALPPTILASMLSYRGRARVISPLALVAACAIAINISEYQLDPALELQLFIGVLIIIWPLHRLIEAASWSPAVQQSVFHALMLSSLFGVGLVALLQPSLFGSLVPPIGFSILAITLLAFKGKYPPKSITIASLILLSVYLLGVIKDGLPPTAQYAPALLLAFLGLPVVHALLFSCLIILSVFFTALNTTASTYEVMPMLLRVVVYGSLFAFVLYRWFTELEERQNPTLAHSPSLRFGFIALTPTSLFALNLFASAIILLWINFPVLPPLGSWADLSDPQQVWLMQLTLFWILISWLGAVIGRKALQVRASEDRLKATLKRQQDTCTLLSDELQRPAQQLRHLLKLQQAQAPNQETQEALIARSDELLESLNDLSKITHPDSVDGHDKPSVNIKQMLEALLQDHKQPLQQRGIRAKLNAEVDSDRQVRVHRHLLAQILKNLLRHALASAQVKAINFTLETARQEDGQLAANIIMIDNGDKLSNEEVRNIFSPIELSSDHQQGLNLFFSRELAHNLGGQLYYSPRLEGGNRFVLRVPIDVYEEDQIKPPKVQYAGMRILLAEDSKAIRTISATILSNAGSEVDVASNGQEALEHFNAASQTYDVVLIDIGMPIMNGYELTKTLRQQGFAGRIIGITGASLNIAEPRMLAAGADAVLMKPMTMKSLTACLAALDDADMPPASLVSEPNKSGAPA